MAKQSLAEWIHEAMIDGDKLLGGLQDLPCSGFALVHMPGGGGIGGQQKEVCTVKFTGAKAWKADELGKLFWKRAENYCQDATSVQTFALLAFYGADEHKATHPFIVNVHPENGGFFGEGADDKGERAQHMRQKEMVFQQMLAQQQHLNNHYQRTLEASSREAHDAKTENREMFSIMKEMIMEKATNDHERSMAQLTYQRATAERSKLIKMIPPLTNTIAGRPVFPVETADTAIIEMIAEAIDTDGLQKLMTSGIVKPEMMGPLVARLQQVLQTKREEAEALAALRPPPGDPVDDAGGGEGSGLATIPSTRNGTGRPLQ